VKSERNIVMKIVEPVNTPGKGKEYLQALTF